LKESACRVIEQEKERIIGWSKAIAGKPELGYKENQTAELIRTAFAGLGLPTRTGIAVTGVEGLLEGARSGPGLLFMGEMDAVVNRESSAADPVTGAAHLCGHHLQVGIMLGAALGLIQAGARDHLSGKVFSWEPGGRIIEIEERLRMREQEDSLPGRKAGAGPAGVFEGQTSVRAGPCHWGFPRGRCFSAEGATVSWPSRSGSMENPPTPEFPPTRGSTP
jgi:hypothetical protein